MRWRPFLLALQSFALAYDGSLAIYKTKKILDFRFNYVRGLFNRNLWKK
jgi:hypothetical protein